MCLCPVLGAKRSTVVTYSFARILPALYVLSMFVYGYLLLAGMSGIETALDIPGNTKNQSRERD